MNSPGRAGFSPGFCGLVIRVSVATGQKDHIRIMVAAIYLSHKQLKRTQPSQAQPGPTLHISSLEIQVSPQALPLRQILQHSAGFFISRTLV